MKAIQSKGLENSKNYDFTNTDLLRSGVSKIPTVLLNRFVQIAEESLRLRGGDDIVNGLILRLENTKKNPNTVEEATRVASEFVSEQILVQIIMSGGKGCEEDIQMH